MTELFARALTPRIGAVLDDVSPCHLLGEGTVDRLHHALMQHHVVFLPDAEVEPRVLAALGRSLGPVANDHHRYQSHPDELDVVVLEWGGDRRPDAAEWHADMTYRPDPPFASLLQAVVVPPVGGDTLWASMFAVYDALPRGLRDDLADLQAVHDMGAFRTPAYLEGGNGGITAELVATGSAVHPVVARHPVTDRPYLNVSESFTRFVIGLSAAESTRLLAYLFDVVNRPDHQVRLSWRPGTIAIWDNRGTQHYAIDDYLPHRRVMHRVAVLEDTRTR